MMSRPKYLKILLMLLISVNLFLVACSGATATSVRPTSTPLILPVAATPTPEIIITPTPTFTIPPTFTPFRAPTTLTPTARPPATPTPTRAATPTPVIAPTATPLIGSFENFGKISFRSAYTQALTLAGNKFDRRASMVLAHVNLVAPERPIWTFYMVLVEFNQMWTLSYDPGNTNVTVLGNQRPVLVADAGQIDINRVLDSPDIVRRLLTRGFPAATPIDTVYIQMNLEPRTPAYTLINSTFNKQVVVNAYTGEVVQNTFGQ